MSARKNKLLAILFIIGVLFSFPPLWEFVLGSMCFPPPQETLGAFGGAVIGFVIVEAFQQVKGKLHLKGNILVIFCVLLFLASAVVEIWLGNSNIAKFITPLSAGIFISILFSFMD